jgi:ABC-type branched-subunit amino acid transport system ATPase component
VKPILKVRGVTKRFGGVVANDSVSLEVPKGAIIGLIGPNGSGKTTLFNAIAGTFPIDKGSIRFKGEELSESLTPEIARKGLIRTFQQPRIFTRMTVLQNMLVSASIRQADFTRLFHAASTKDERQAVELLDFVGLAGKHDIEAGSLSYGQQKLLELAMALMNDPELLLLDEPTAGINPVLTERLLDRLGAANRERGLTLLVIEHNMPVIMAFAERIYCLAHGRVLAEGTPRQIRSNKRVVEAYLGAA